MTITSKDCFHLILIFYGLLLFFTTHPALIAGHFCEDRKAHKRKQKNFFFGWAIIFISAALIVIPILIFGTNQSSPELVLFFGLSPLVLSGLIMTSWRYHGPVIVFTHGHAKIFACKLLSSFSEYYNIKYETFHLFYGEGNNFISDKFERLNFQVRFDCNTVDQLYLHFVYSFQNLKTDYTCKQRNVYSLSAYVEREMEALFQGVVIKNQTALEDAKLDSENKRFILETIKSEFIEQIKIQYEINPLVDKITFGGVKHTSSIFAFNS